MKKIKVTKINELYLITLLVHLLQGRVDDGPTSAEFFGNFSDPVIGVFFLDLKDKIRG
jgi:hypothetical protein